MSPRPGADVRNSGDLAILTKAEMRGEPAPVTSAFSAGMALVRARPGLALLLAYVAVTVVARFDDIWYYRLFRINVNSYSSAVDFFLAPLRHSVVLLFFAAPAAVVALVSWAGRARGASRLPSRAGSARAPGWNTPMLRFLVAISFIFVTAAILTRLHAGARADDLKQGNGKSVTFTTSDGVRSSERPMLIGSTGTFFFLYHRSRNTAEIIPVENTSQITFGAEEPEDSAPVQAEETRDKPPSLFP